MVASSEPQRHGERQLLQECDETVACIAQILQNSSHASTPATTTVEPQVRACLEELLHSFERSMEERSSRSLAEQRQQLENLFHLRQSRDVFSRDALKENLGSAANAGVASSAHKKESCSDREPVESDRRLVEMQQAITKSEQKSTRLQRRLDDKHLDLEVIELRLKERAAELEQKIHASEAELAQANLQLCAQAQREDDSKALQRTMAEQREKQESNLFELATRESILKGEEVAQQERDQRLLRREYAVSAREEDLSKSERTQRDAVQRFRHRTSEQEAEHSESERQLDERRMEVRAKEESVAARERAIEARVAGSEQELRERLDAAAVNADFVSKRLAELVSREECVRARECALDAREIEIQALSDAAARSQATTQLASNHLADLDARERALDMREAEIRQLSVVAANSHSSGQQALNSREEDISARERASEVRETELRQRQACAERAALDNRRHSAELEGREERTLERARAMEAMDGAHGEAERRLVDWEKQLRNSEDQVGQREQAVLAHEEKLAVRGPDTCQETLRSSSKCVRFSELEAVIDRGGEGSTPLSPAAVYTAPCWPPPVSQFACPPASEHPGTAILGGGLGHEKGRLTARKHVRDLTGSAGGSSQSSFAGETSPTSSRVSPVGGVETACACDAISNLDEPSPKRQMLSPEHYKETKQCGIAGRLMGKLFGRSD